MIVGVIKKQDELRFLFTTRTMDQNGRKWLNECTDRYAFLQVSGDRVPLGE
jgi:hypothetical protein